MCSSLARAGESEEDTMARINCHLPDFRAAAGRDVGVVGGDEGVVGHIDCVESR
jgi:hypothetical protein